MIGNKDDILIAGIVIQGPAAKRVLIRGVGPSLAEFGVPGTLADPIITVFDASGAPIVSNDDWGNTTTVHGLEVTGEEIQAAAGSCGAFGLKSGSKDAALLMTRPSGNYTIHVAGKGGSTGIGLVEAYEVPAE